VQVKIAVRHGHLSDDAQQLIRDKAEKLLHFFERLTMIEVTVDLKVKERKTVEILARAEHKHDIVAQDSHADVVVAMDLAMNKVEAQVRRYKEKIQDHRRTPSAGEVAGSASRDVSPEE
jgi:putative sigma-54 modulation protein